MFIGEGFLGQVPAHVAFLARDSAEGKPAAPAFSRTAGRKHFGASENVEPSRLEFQPSLEHLAEVSTYGDRVLGAAVAATNANGRDRCSPRCPAAKTVPDFVRTLCYQPIISVASLVKRHAPNPI